MLDHACREIIKKDSYSVTFGMDSQTQDKSNEPNLIECFVPDGCPEACASQRPGESLQIFFTLLKDLIKNKQTKKTINQKRREILELFLSSISVINNEARALYC